MPIVAKNNILRFILGFCVVSQNLGIDNMNYFLHKKHVRGSHCSKLELFIPLLLPLVTVIYSDVSWTNFIIATSFIFLFSDFQVKVICLVSSGCACLVRIRFKLAE